MSEIILKKGVGDYAALAWVPGQTGRTRTPLVLFLHGSGERGDDLEKVVRHGIPKLIRVGRTFPFVVVAPQCPEGWWWQGLKVSRFLDRVAGRFHADPARIYVTGISMGGAGVWELVATCPERLAAAAPVCGPYQWFPAERFGQVPVWCFHGAMDEVVPITDSIRRIREVRKAGGQVRFTVYPDAGHDAWSETYTNPKLYRWLLAQRLGSHIPCSSGSKRDSHPCRDR
jgi:predicted peptidase